MKKLVAAVFAASMLTAVAPIAMSTSAMAVESAPECAALGAVAGNGGYWVYVPPQPLGDIVYGTEVTFTSNGNNVSGNGFVTATQVTAPAQCIGYNKSDNQKGDEWVRDLPGTGGTTALEPVKVCQNVGNRGDTTSTDFDNLAGDFDCPELFAAQ